MHYPAQTQTKPIQQNAVNGGDRGRNRSTTDNYIMQNQPQQEVNTAWKAKKIRQVSDNEVLKLINRIKLLQKEDQKNNQKLQEAKKKTNEILLQKKKQEEELN